MTGKHSTRYRLDPARGAAGISPAHERWVLLEKSNQRRRCGTCFATLSFAKNRFLRKSELERFVGLSGLGRDAVFRVSGNKNPLPAAGRNLSYDCLVCYGSIIWLRTA
jgi:hypothetical protein